MRCLGKLVAVVVLALAVLAGWWWSGSYDIGADAPHWKVTARLIGVLRERSIDTRLAGIKVPQLDDPTLVTEGAAHYSEMCTQCHLAPGMTDSETRAGLYPQPPKLTKFAPDPAEAFWIIKHGIKMSAMPAWGKTHDDQKIWAMVAYLQQQPKMSAERYHQLTAHAAEVEDGDHQDATPAMPDMPAPAASTH
ncbi:MAG: cytochrome c [Rhodanobacter sp.]|nr:MAG: cytochrome c [Rhodanobacter sp.]TAM13697.1 MAG: cytochrome c [Rhodanobacter sp.]TAM35828.1 MAG: cytochrome c [Rhodanobacter sp.]